MNKTPLTVVAILLAAVVGAGITWALIHVRFPNTKDLDDAYYALIIKEPHTVSNAEKFKSELSSLQHNGQQDVSYCFELDGELLKYPEDTECPVNQPRMPALTHRIYAVSPWDIAKVALEIDGKVPVSATTPTPTP